MVKDTKKDYIYELVPTNYTDGKMDLKCRLTHINCDFHATVFSEMKLKLDKYLEITDIIEIFKNTNNSELYDISNYKDIIVYHQHDKFCYNYLYGELVSGMLKKGSVIIINY